MQEQPSNSVASATELVVRFGNQVVLDRLRSRSWKANESVWSGRNGSGKSTFLQIAAGVMAPDAGELNRRRDLVVGYMPQMFELDETASVHANILAGAQRVLDLIEEYETAPPESARSGILLEQIEHFDGWNLEHRIKSLITNLHAPEPERAVATLSGGEKRRVALCRALLARPDFLILDEPTNHLDTGSIEWLEDFLARYQRDVSLRDARSLFPRSGRDARGRAIAAGNSYSYAGNYTDYLLARAERAAVEEMQENKRQKFLKRELAWVRKAPRARRTKSVDRVERYFEMAAQEAPEAELDVDLIIPPAPKLANRVIELRDVSMELGGRRLIDNLRSTSRQASGSGSSGAMASANRRCSKSCSDKSSRQAAKLKSARGRRSITSTKTASCSMTRKPFGKKWVRGCEYVRLGEENITLRSYLRRFLFTEERINTKIDQLSGGERSRVLLAKILEARRKRPHS